MHSLTSEYGSSIFCLHLVIHAITGCVFVNSFSRTGKKSIPDTWKENWWVDGYARLGWVPINLFGMLFCGCRYSICLPSVPGEQSNFKYLEISLCASIEPTITNWKWTANERWEVLWRAHLKFFNPRCKCKKCKFLVCTEMCSCNINEDCENRNHKILYECVEEENWLRQVNKVVAVDYMWYFC